MAPFDRPMLMDDNEGCDFLYKIGELSKLCSLPVKTLRYYDAEGLLVPDEIDRFTGYRYYSAARLADCNRIVALKELGFSLGEIKRRLRADSPADILALIDGKKAELEKALSQTESQLHRLDIVRRDITEGDNCMFDMLIRDADAVHVAYTRKNFDTKDEACAEIEKIRLALPAVVTGRRTVIINYETEYRERSFDLAACVEITGKPPRDCGYEEKLIAFSGDTASLVCKRGELDDAYRFMTRQLEETPCQIIGPFYEISHDDDTVELKVPVCKLSREQDRHVDDDIDLPFVNDPDAVGKWKLLDIVPSEEQFLYGNEKCGHSAWLHDLYFLKDGQSYWGVGGWTKGYLFTRHDMPKYTFKNKYTIKNVDSRKLMFIEMKDYKTEARGGLPEIWVYEKVSDAEYKREDIALCDNVDYLFIPDESVIGEWRVCDFVIRPEQFDASKQNFPEADLFFKSVAFASDGTCVTTTGNGKGSWPWTKGLLLNKRSKTAEAYEIKRIDGKEYLFVEWKSGDYIFGGGRIYWYIFTRG